MYAVRVSRRRLRRRDEKARRHAPPQAAAASQREVLVREATRVERLAYTRTQAAAALGISRASFDRRVLPLIETVEMPWGRRLIPADELRRLVADGRRRGRGYTKTAKRGRPPSLAPTLVARIRAEYAAGRSLAEIARDLNDSHTPTAHGGSRWWPSTVRAVVRRS